ncbi:MAG: family N-acetyltransferase [Chitinophagaceae bacterium]|nr:family N-acetyltransferase [Chitinophagaceae bacterium]
MHPLLYNPVYNALLTGDSHLDLGNQKVKYFDEAVSPFVGFEDKNTNGFDELHKLFPPNRAILYATPISIETPRGWKLLHEMNASQFVFEGSIDFFEASFPLMMLKPEHAQQMVQLAELTKPGPFNLRTIEFGNYYGVFDNDQLVAMTGQRLHVSNYTEVSAVCTHPDYLGRGYAAALIRHQLNIIVNHSQIPFLHVRKDHESAIGLYKKLGFTVCRPMNFYFMKRLD